MAIYESVEGGRLIFCGAGITEAFKADSDPRKINLGKC